MSARLSKHEFMPIKQGQKYLKAHNSAPPPHTHTHQMAYISGDYCGINKASLLSRAGFPNNDESLRLQVFCMSDATNVNFLAGNANTHALLLSSP